MAGTWREELELALGDSVDDLGIAQPLAVEDEGRSPFTLMPEVKSVIVHPTALAHVVDRYGGSWWIHRYPHVKQVNALIEEFLAQKGFRYLSIS